MVSPGCTVPALNWLSQSKLVLLLALDMLLLLPAATTLLNGGTAKLSTSVTNTASAGSAVLGFRAKALIASSRGPRFPSDRLREAAGLISALPVHPVPDGRHDAARTLLGVATWWRPENVGDTGEQHQLEGRRVGAAEGRVAERQGPAA